MNPKVIRSSLHHFFIRAAVGPQQCESLNPCSSADMTNNLWQQIHRPSISRALCLEQCCRAAQAAPRCARLTERPKSWLNSGSSTWRSSILRRALRMAWMDTSRKRPRGRSGGGCFCHSQHTSRSLLKKQRCSDSPSSTDSTETEHFTVNAVSHFPTPSHLMAWPSFECLSLQRHTYIQHPAFTGSARIKTRSWE